MRLWTRQATSGSSPTNADHELFPLLENDKAILKALLIGYQFFSSTITSTSTSMLDSRNRNIFDFFLKVISAATAFATTVARCLMCLEYL